MAQTFLRWAGNKSQIKEHILQRFPPLETIKYYYEPFLGSGSIFLEVLDRCYLDEYYINDCNSDLTALFDIVLTSPDILEMVKIIYSNLVKEYNDAFDKAVFYYDIRAKYNSSSPTDFGRIPQFLFLNQTCFNGLWRVNSKGEFNSPFNKKGPAISTTELFYRLDYPQIVLGKNPAMKSVISSGDFDFALPEGDNQHIESTFIYLDPPYYPISPTANFTQFSQLPFGLDEQLCLRLKLKLLDNLGYKWLLSNSDCELIRQIYRGYTIEEIQVPRKINCKGDKRGCVTELLIRNY